MGLFHPNSLPPLCFFVFFIFIFLFCLNYLYSWIISSSTVTPPFVLSSASLSSHPLSPGRDLHLGRFWRPYLSFSKLDFHLLSLPSTDAPHHRHLRPFCFSSPSSVLPSAPFATTRDLHTLAREPHASLYWCFPPLHLLILVVLGYFPLFIFYCNFIFLFCCCFCVIVSPCSCAVWANWRDFYIRRSFLINGSHLDFGNASPSTSSFWGLL